MNKTILRIEKGLSPSETLLTNIKAFLGEVTIEEFYPLTDKTASIDFSKYYQQRIESLLNAFVFFCNHALKEKRETLALLIAWLCKHFQLDEHTNQVECQAQLEQCICIFVDAICQGTGVSKSQAADLLNLAEQYVLFVQGRPKHATLSSVASGESKTLVLQVDTPIAPVHPQSLQELENIKKSAHPEHLSAAFLNLPSLLQLYLLNSALTDTAQINAELSLLHVNCENAAFLIKMDTVEKLHPDETQYKGLNAITPYALRLLFCELYNLYDGDAASMLVLLGDIQRSASVFLQSASAEQLAEIRQLPFWYYCLSTWERLFLWESMQQVDVALSDTWYLPSRLRSSIPALANAAKHCLYKIENDSLHSFSAPTTRSAHVASRAMTGELYCLQRLHCERNIEVVYQQAKALLFTGTLISPVSAFGLDNITPDAKLQAVLDKTLTHMARVKGTPVYSTNHMLNVAKEFYYTTPTNAHSNQLLARANATIKERQYPSTHKLCQLVEQYKALLAARAKDWFSIRELLLAAKEQLIAKELGLATHGSCVSGKDRFALLLTLQDCMLLFYEIHAHWPYFEDKMDMRILTQLFLTLFASGHQMQEASFGAPGAFGVKTPGRYLPKSYLDGMQTWGHNALTIDRMASNNEVKKIGMSSYKPGFSGALLEAIQIALECGGTINGLLPCKISELIAKTIPMELFCYSLQTAEPKDALWLANLVYNPEAALYVRWIIRAKDIDHSAVRSLLSAIHVQSQEDNWGATSVSYALSFGLWGESNGLPEGIKNIRSIMTRSEHNKTNPMQVLTNILFAARVQLHKPHKGFLRSQKTWGFYQNLDAILRDPAPLEHWSMLIEPFLAEVFEAPLSTVATGAMS